MVDPQTNQPLDSASPETKNNFVWMGVLDIFGFEFVKKEKIVEFVDKNGKANTESPSVNSFEQFCINLCNEQLQEHLVNVIFGLEQQLYKNELGAEINIAFDKNSDTVELIKGKTGIIATLDSIAKNPPVDQKNPGSQEKADTTFYDQLTKLKLAPRGNDRFGSPLLPRLSFPQKKGKDAYYGQGFDLDHYAAIVRYDIKDWVLKDADKLNPDVYACFAASGDTQFLAKQLSVQPSSKDPPVVAGAFKNKLGNLITTLSAADSNFVRCIKCSNPLQKDVFFTGEVLNQLKYTGMLDTLKIRRAGFAMRHTFQSFWDNYHVLDVKCESPGDLVESIQKNTVPAIVAKMNAAQVAEIASQKNPDGTYDAIRMGQQKLVLARDWLGSALDEERKIVLGKSAVIIQAKYRGSQQEREYKRNEAAWTIQSALRSVSTSGSYGTKKVITHQLLPDMHAFTARIIASRGIELANMKIARQEMMGFLNENKMIESQEANERKICVAEDDYSWKIGDASFTNRVDADKKTYLDITNQAYKQAMEKYKDVKVFLDRLKSKGAESDSRWQKMQTEGIVRSVPLVRQYKAEAGDFTPPKADAYRFKYSFSYKGVKATPVDSK